MPSPPAIARANLPDRTHLAPVPSSSAAWALLIRHARCADAGLDPDDWFPVSAEAGKARREAAAAIAICNSCLVRAECLTLSLQHWEIGKHGIWGGLVAAERAGLRRQFGAGRSGCGSAPARVVVTAPAR